MLSICLPVFNEDIRQLVTDLHQQCSNCNLQFEILVADDHSSDCYLKTNRAVGLLLHTELIELRENIGRAAIRNFLAARSRFPNLLFLDADTQVCSADFISSYLVHSSSALVVCGGIAYSNSPREQGFRLRQKYGLKREVVPLAQRKLQPYRSFMTGNYWIKRDTALQHPFLETIRSYGHEDTIFGLDLEKSKIQIYHIHNPILHCPKDSDLEFIHKVKQSASNLAQLDTLLRRYDDVSNKIKLLKYAEQLGSFHLGFIFKLLYLCIEQFKAVIFRWFPFPLFLLDVYKLGWYLKSKA